MQNICKLAFKFQSLWVIEKCGEHFMAMMQWAFYGNDADLSSFSLAESSPRDLQITAYK